MEQFEFHQIDARDGREWTNLSPSISEVILNHDPSTGRKTVLQRYQPGAVTDEIAEHNYIEEVFLVEGDLIDTTLGQGWTKGAYAYRKPGMKHGPYRSESGCLMFVVCIPVQHGEEMEGRT